MVETTDTITVTGGNNGIAGDVYQAVVIPASGLVSFAWSYSTIDAGAHYDGAHYYINGSFAEIPAYSPAGSLTQSGIATINVTAGQTLGFGIFTTDGLFGAATLKVYFFNGPVTGNIDWYSLSPTQTFIITEQSGVDVPVISTVYPVHQYQAFSSGNGCTATQGTTLNVNVNELPVGTVNNQTICNGSSTNILYSSMHSITGITWTTSNNPLITGYSNCNSGCSGVITQTLNNALVYKDQSISYHVTATATSGCTYSDTAMVIVLPAVSDPVNVFSQPDSVCLPAQTDVTAISSFPQNGFAG